MERQMGWIGSGPRESKVAVSFCFSILLLLSSAVLTSSAEPIASNFAPGFLSGDHSEPKQLWRSEPGHGFQGGVETFTAGVGMGHGPSMLGSKQRHDMFLGTVQYGRMLRSFGSCSGNIELRLELFGGGQFSPEKEWLVGLTPHLRYNFATGTRWVPFIDAGAGILGTSIGRPDLGGPFQFNSQGAAGVHRFLRDDLAITAEARFIHISSARFYSPNRGVNEILGVLGVTWFF